MRIRSAHVRDIPQITEIVLNVYRETFQPLFPDSDLLAEFNEKYWEWRFSQTLGSIRIAEAEDRVIGFCGLSLSRWKKIEPGLLGRWQRCRNIDILFVAQGLRGRGAGTFLLKESEQRGARTLECFEANKAARRFYSRHGWIEELLYQRDFAGGPKRFVRLITGPEFGGLPLPEGARRIEQIPQL